MKSADKAELFAASARGMTSVGLLDLGVVYGINLLDPQLV